MKLSRSLPLTFAALTATACGEQAQPGGSPESTLRVTVSALSLDGLSDACYSLSAWNTSILGMLPANYPPANLVWERTPICASDFGIGNGGAGDVQTTGITYVGACDASVDTNDVALVLDNLYRGGEASISQGGGSGTAVPANEFQNPCPASRPCVLSAPCEPFEDTPVSFDLTIMRDGGKGFFDIAVRFKDVFCSAKFDCGYNDGSPIQQVLGLDGQPKPTAVLGFACTAGTDQPSHLYMTKLHVECDGGVSQDILPQNSGVLFDAPHALPLGAAYPTDAVFQAVVSLGELVDTSFTQYYWNVALGFDLSRASNCTLTARATATEGAFADVTLGSGLTPDHTTYPYIDFEIPIDTIGSGAAQRLTCAANDGFRNKLNDTANGSGVKTTYTDVTVRRCFDLSYPGTATVGSVDDAADPTTCTGDVDVACIGFPSSYLGGQVVIQDGVQVSPNPATTPLELRCLQTVSGRIVLTGSFASFPADSFAKLEAVGGLLFSSVSNGGDFSFPSLTQILAQGLSIQGTMGAVSMPSLVTLNGGLTVQQSTLSGGLTIGATTYLQSVLIQTSTLGGVGLQLPSLETVAGNLNITSNINLAAIGLPRSPPSTPADPSSTRATVSAPPRSPSPHSRRHASSSAPTRPSRACPCRCTRAAATSTSTITRCSPASRRLR